MLSNFIDYVKKNKNDLLLGIILFFLLILAFALGYIIAKQQNPEPIEISNSI